ncbi:hypothetical protein GCM10007884_21890 [Methylobacterium brachythecii]|uniref:Uncharacterized protein n=1 Tax=Methylobacterium brachythecii TaxID=1176177 RepID=A0ABQ6D3B1_9HYPH|nr:hypothetical protein GCM10007884_21890 [Methylobacterium brachythecii]
MPASRNGPLSGLGSVPANRRPADIGIDAPEGAVAVSGHRQIREGSTPSSFTCGGSRGGMVFVGGVSGVVP